MIRTVEMSEQLEEVIEDLAEQRIEKQKARHEEDRIKLRATIQEMAAGKEVGLSLIHISEPTRPY